MRSIRSTLCGLVLAGVALGSTSAALASPAQSPRPTPGTTSCSGLIVAFFNHAAPLGSPSGNPNASAGPGSFFGPETPDAIEGARELCLG